jgi:hypothetical protein
VWSSGVQHRNGILQHSSCSFSMAFSLYRPSDRRLSAKLVPNIAAREVSRGQRGGCLGPESRFSSPEPLPFLSCNSSFVLTRLSVPRSRPLLVRKSGSAGNRTRISGFIARNSDHQTTETVVRVPSANLNVFQEPSLIGKQCEWTWSVTSQHLVKSISVERYVYGLHLFPASIEMHFGIWK